MTSSATIKLQRRQRRQARVRGSIRGTTARPRLAVFRSLKHIYAQVIDDSRGRTLASAGTMDKAIRSEVTRGGNVKAATAIGKIIAARALEKGIVQVAFDRGPYRFHGRVKALAAAAREGGLKF
ncbi:MAG: 50S ribosomal protein L18 [Planctomycetes bacterium]|nr:50S ribosomal protein L18 [Planctomycetota bacterium]